MVPRDLDVQLGDPTQHQSDWGVESIQNIGLELEVAEVDLASVDLRDANGSVTQIKGKRQLAIKQGYHRCMNQLLGYLPKDLGDQNPSSARTCPGTTLVRAEIPFET